MSLFTEACTRLKGYNLGIYNAITNALGVSGVGGMAKNWARALKDMATVGETVAGLAEAVSTSTATVTAARDDVQTRQGDVVTKHGQVTSMTNTVAAARDDVQARQGDITTKHGQVTDAATQVAQDRTAVSTYVTTMGAALVATSSTNNVAIGTGTKTLTIETGKGFAAGTYLVATDAANAANSMTGRVTSYTPGTGVLVLEVAAGDVAGSGTPGSWKVGISGKTGPAGPGYALPVAAAGTLGGVKAGAGVVVAGDGTLSATPASVGAFPASGGKLTGPAQGKDAVTLTMASTIAVNFAASNSFKVTLTSSATLGFPSNVVAEQSGTIYVYQDGTGGRTLALASGYVAAGGLSQITITTTAGAETAIDYVAESATRIHLSCRKDIKA